LSEERRLRVFENGVLSRIFGAKRDEVIGEWRRVHNKELYALYIGSFTKTAPSTRSSTDGIGRDNGTDS
jgi:hypothetical protein